MTPRVISVLTTGRADWGLAAPIARALADDADFELRLIVAAAHLNAAPGRGLDRIVAEGHQPAHRLPWGQGTPAERAGRMLSGMAAILAADPADALLVVGDRFEVLAAAQGASLTGTPLIHLGGGDVTEGALDDAYRHALTKLSHVHLVTHAEAVARVRALGEAAERIHLVGNPALDGLAERAALSLAELEAGLGAPLGARNLLLTFHPVTLVPDHGQDEFEAVLEALDRLDGVTFWVSEPNDDPGGEALRGRLREWAAERPNAHVRAALGPLFPALAARCEAVIGNSSAGLAEVPTLGVPTVDVGLRQQGRLAGSSVIHAEAEPGAILAALDRAHALDRSMIANPYGDGRSTPRILEVVRALPSRQTLLMKSGSDPAG